LNTLGTVVSIYHLAMKFLSTSGDIIIVHVNQPTVHRCYADSLRERPRSPPRRIVNNVEKVLGEEGVDLDPRVSDEVRVEPIETIENFHFGDEH